MRSRTWRGRLVGSDRRGHEKGPEVSSGKKFEDLDEYLRGSAAVAAQRVKRKRGRFIREGGGESTNIGTTTDVLDGDSSVETESHNEVRYTTPPSSTKYRECERSVELTYDKSSTYSMKL